MPSAYPGPEWARVRSDAAGWAPGVAPTRAPGIGVAGGFAGRGGQRPAVLSARNRAPGYFSRRGVVGGVPATDARYRSYRNGFTAVLLLLFAHYSYQYLVLGEAEWATTSVFFAGLCAFYGSLLVYDYGPLGS